VQAVNRRAAIPMPTRACRELKECSANRGALEVRPGIAAELARGLQETKAIVPRARSQTGSQLGRRRNSASQRMTSPTDHEFIMELAHTAGSSAQISSGTGHNRHIEGADDPCCSSDMRVEYLDAHGRWRPLENATAARLKPGLCEIAITESSPAWRARSELLDGSLLRVDGIETNRIIARRVEEDKIIVTATTRVSVPEAEAD
jgi:hypothetical protein